ncbi:MAG: MalY/PatB family protein [Oscillospiraceae bacterium]|jgi:cystathionine beta-lyase
MKYDFDTPVSRYGTDAAKYAGLTGAHGELLPLWVADMDFPAPPEVVAALQERVAHGIYGYGDLTGETYFAPLRKWYAERFDWKLQREWLVKTPGVVFAVYNALRALTRENDAVLLQEPVYYPFARAIRDNGRRVAVSELVYENGRYRVDYEDFERKIEEEGVRAFILCSPHNPVGRVWTREELTRMGEICLRHGVKVVADEIHADFVRPGHRHTVFASISPAFADNTITCTAPSKTFNLAGLQISNIFISNEEMREAFKREVGHTGYGEPNILGVVSCQAAYEKGGEWLEELKDYLENNIAYVREYLAEHIPQIKLVEPEGTYLLWLDCRALGMQPKELDDFIYCKAGLWLDDGRLFGKGGEGFQRINIACPRVMLEEAMKRLEDAVKAL